MSEIMKLIIMSDEYLLGRIHEKATLEELEMLIRIRKEVTLSK